ncbi:MAG: hypothetical protein U5R31_14075 [Acidimicrobiia bacterium]|nr:hypothetical protein [Acidimicrobiia bacterium]
MRRRSGGGAVLLDPDDVAVWADVVIPAGDPLADDDVGRATHVVGRLWVDVLGTLGVDARVHTGGLERTDLGRLVCFADLGPGEVTVGGRKVVGISQRRTAWWGPASRPSSSVGGGRRRCSGCSRSTPPPVRGGAPPGPGGRRGRPPHGRPGRRRSGPTSPAEHWRGPAPDGVGDAPPPRPAAPPPRASSPHHPGRCGDPFRHAGADRG